MLTLDALRQYGANVKEGLSRCMDNEAFYLRMIGMAVRDEKITSLDAAVKSKDFKTAFELAHGLKGMYANLSLTPLSVPLSEITELLRNGTDTDYSPLMNEIILRKRMLDELCA